ncbi:transposase [Aliiroseovarius sp. F20344]|uniref:transposase n=1 Tax=Aliiroseovarius sp. F20344 TaxID=2926414 RepID=UPI001FF2E102|nr:transposase [Aliiroseovarius sp. F20344]MCK0142999.1 transposase [Aliiroseovarius sp. F20344]
MAAWLGLTPLNTSSGGKDRLGRITKKVERYIRRLLINGMTASALMAKDKPEKADIWTAKLLDEKPFRLATVAKAKKSARIIWAMLTNKSSTSNRSPDPAPRCKTLGVMMWNEVNQE